MNATLPDKDTIIEQLGLQQHPEGGYFKETYRSEAQIKNAHLPGNYEGDRHVSTAIYFMLTSDMFSAFHKIEQDELWHFHFGSAIELHTISPAGKHEIHLIGNNMLNGECPQLIVPGNYWFAAKVIDPDSYSLVSCTVAPGFDFRDFILPQRETLVKLFPEHKEVIAEFTRI